MSVSGLDNNTPEQRKWARYERLCERNSRKASDLRWEQGRLADYGERVFPENYLQAMTGKFGLEQGTIQNRLRVFRKFPTKKERLWDVDFMWYETLQAKDWDTIVEYMNKVEAGEYENREQLRAEFRIGNDSDFTTCKLHEIATVLAEYGMDMESSVEVTIKDSSVRIKLAENKDNKVIDMPQVTEMKKAS